MFAINNILLVQDHSVYEELIIAEIRLFVHSFYS